MKRAQGSEAERITAVQDNFALVFFPHPHPLWFSSSPIPPLVLLALDEPAAIGEAGEIEEFDGKAVQ